MIDAMTKLEVRASAYSANRGEPWVSGPDWFVLFDSLASARSNAPLVDAAARAFSTEARPSAFAAVCDVIDAANRAVAASPGDAFTVVGVVPVAADEGRALAVFHLGDSRCYRLVDGALSLLTRDHTYLNELIESSMTEGAASPSAERRYRHVVTRALGFTERPEPTMTIVPMCASRLLLCTRSVVATLTPASIGRVLAGCADPASAARRLVDLAQAPANHTSSTGAAAAMVIDVGAQR